MESLRYKSTYCARASGSDESVKLRRAFLRNALTERAIDGAGLLDEELGVLAAAGGWLGICELGAGALLCCGGGLLDSVVD